MAAQERQSKVNWVREACPTPPHSGPHQLTQDQVDDAGLSKGRAARAASIAGRQLGGLVWRSHAPEAVGFDCWDGRIVYIQR